MMGLLGKASPKLAEELCGHPVVVAIAQGVQSLLAEQVPVRDIRSIAEAIATTPPRVRYCRTGGFGARRIVPRNRAKHCGA